MGQRKVRCLTRRRRKNNIYCDGKAGYKNFSPAVPPVLQKGNPLGWKVQQPSQTKGGWSLFSVPIPLSRIAADGRTTGGKYWKNRRPASEDEDERPKSTPGPGCNLLADSVYKSVYKFVGLPTNLDSQSLVSS
jgi:hypothetical protein